MTTNDSRRRWGLPISKQDLDDEVSEEIAYHLERRTQKLIDQGLDPERAHDEAQRRFGNVRTVHEECLDLSQQTQNKFLRLQALSEFKNDAKYAFRGLRRRPAFALSAILTLALGIGATTGIYSLLDAVLLRSLPYTESDRLVTMWPWGLSQAFYEGFSELDEFENVSAYYAGDATLTGTGEPARLVSALVTPEFFTTLGTMPLRGRGFLPSDGETDAPLVAVLSEDFWQQRFNGDPAVLEQSIQLDGEPHSVVGIMPKSLALPSGDTQVWRTFKLASKNSGHYWGSQYLQLFGRLAEGVTEEQALAASDTKVRQLVAENPIWTPSDEWASQSQIAPFQEKLAGDLKGLLSLLFWAVIAVLLVVCVNVANLFLSRATAKQQETAIRASLGAGRGRLLQQSLVEAWAVALAGTLLGLGLAAALLHWLRSELPGFNGQFGEVHLDLRVLGFALALSVVTTLIFGTLPALRFTRQSNLPSAVRGNRGQTTKGHGGTALVVAQLALSAVLLTAGGVLLSGFQKQLSAETGIETERVIAARLSPANGDYQDEAKRARLYRQATELLEAMPTVESAAASNTLPFGQTFQTAYDAPDRNYNINELPTGAFRHVTSGYFRTLGIPLLRGRDFGPEDTLAEDGPSCTKENLCAAIINKTMAETTWPDLDPMGRTIGADWQGWFRVVGIAADAAHSVVDQEVLPMLYMPQSQKPQPSLQLVVRTRASVQEMEDAIVAAVRQVDPEVPVTSVRMLKDDIWESAAKARLATVLIGAFAVTALLLAAIGVYGVVAYRADQRRREIGIRLALGSTPRRLERRELFRVVGLCAVGVVAGAALSIVALRFLGASALLESTLGSWSLSPMVWVAPPLMLTAVALFAGWLPARRASQIDPLVALRTE